MKRILSFIVAAMFTGQALAATTFTIGDLKYTVTDETNHYVSVDKGSTNPTGALEIPSTVKNGGVTYTVTSIDVWGFEDCNSLTTVTIPNSVTSIGISAFEGCSNLSSVNIPEGVKTISDQLFLSCSSLTSVTISNSVTSIGKYAFSDCSSLTTVTIPNSVTSIGSFAFYNCSGLTTVTIPNSVTSIGGGAFSDCSSLTTVTIPNSVTSIGSHAFSYCIGLTSVTIPNSVTSIGDLAFYGCSSLTEINVESANTKYTSENGVLFNKDKTTILCYPAGKTGTTYTIPNSVTSIDGSAFSGCSGLTTVTIPNSVTTIGNDAFSHCNNLIIITIPNSVTSIGEGAFGNCYGIISVTIPNSVTNIGGYAFCECNGLTSVTFPNSVATIGKSAFYNCSGLTSVTFPNSVTTIGKSAFEGCGNLSAIVFDGTSEPTIGTDAFQYVSSSVKVCVPKDYTSETFGGFSVCKGLVHDNATEPTCTETGLTEGVHCSNCGRVFVAQEEIPATGHSYSTAVTAPTCTEVGFTTHNCTVCDYTYNSDTVAATGHAAAKAVAENYAAPTCTAAGAVDSVVYCAVCQNELLRETKEIAATGHTEVTDAAVPATCTTAGKTEGKHCSVCNETIVAQTEIAALGHEFKDYVYNNDATTAANGTETATCTRGCGATDTRTAAGTKLAETPEKGTAVAESAANAVTIYAHHNTIVVENATDEIRIYNAMGKLVCKDVTPCVRIEIPVTAPGVYIVKVGGTAKRVMVN